MNNLPSYSGSGGNLCFHYLTKFLITIGVSAIMAAAVFEVGTDAQSPIAQILVYLTCCNVLGLTFT